MERNLTGNLWLNTRSCSQDEKTNEAILLNASYYAAWREKREKLLRAEGAIEGLKQRDKELYEFFFQNRQSLVNHAISYFAKKICELPNHMLGVGGASISYKEEDFPPYKFAINIPDYEVKGDNEEYLAYAIQCAFLAEFPSIPNMKLSVVVYNGTADKVYNNNKRLYKTKHSLNVKYILQF